MIWLRFVLFVLKNLPRFVENIIVDNVVRSFAVNVAMRRYGMSACTSDECQKRKGLMNQYIFLSLFACFPNILTICP